MPGLSRSTFSKMWTLLDAHERRLALPVVLVMICAAASSVAMVGAILPFLYVLSHPEIIATDPVLSWARSFVQTDAQVMYALGGVAMVAVGLGTVFGMLRVYAVSRYAGMRSFALSSKMLALLLRQPYAETSALPPALVSKRINSDPSESITAYLMPFGEALASAISTCFMMAFLLWFNALATVVLVGLFVTLYAGVHRFVRPRMRHYAEVRIAATLRRSQTFSEVVRCFREVRMSAHEDAFQLRFLEATKEESRSRISAEFFSKLPRYVLQMTFFLTLVGSAMLLLAFGNSGDTLIRYIPTVGVFMVAGQRMMPEVQNLFSSLTQMSYGAPSVHATYDAYVEMQKQALPMEKGVPMLLDASIDIKGVHHRYADRPHGALHGIELSIPKGQKLGLVGPSGSGKSTLVSILMGLVHPSSGGIYVDGKLLGSNPVSWRLSVAQVPQEVVLVSGTVRANIALGEDHTQVDEDRLWSSLRAAHLDGFVRSLPNGLETDVMAGVAFLSGGQRQRLGLARAFYRNVDVLVLDEATSALDDATEAVILSEIESATTGKTVISVAHRLGSLRGCDRIVALDAGRVVFDGDWEAFRSWKALSEG